jgi:hypothetical protein
MQIHIYERRMMPDMTPVQSSQIESIGWEEGMLYVQFKSNGALYSYDGVTYEMYSHLLSSDSVGSTFSREIRNVFPYQRIA